MNVLYWLKDDDDLKDHAGHRVEVTGEIEGDVEEGEIEIEREKDGIEIEIKSDGRKVKATLPPWAAPMATGVANPPPGDKEIEIKYIVHKLDVKKVKVLGPCS